MLAFAHPVHDGRVYRQAKALAGGDHAVTLIGRGRRWTLLQRYVEDGIRVVEVPGKAPRLLVRAFLDPFVYAALFLVLLFQRRRFDLYYCHEYQSLFAGWVVARLRNKKIIYDCHEYQPESFVCMFACLPMCVQKWIERCFRRFERFCMRRIDAFVTVNEDLAARLLEDCKTGVVVPNYPSKALFAKLEPDPAWVTRLEGMKVLLFAGYVAESRGVTMCVKLLAELVHRGHNVCLLLVGAESPRGYMHKMMRLANTLKVEDRLYWIGRVNHRQLIGFLPLGDVGLNLIQPYPEKNQWAEPTKCFQYAAAGLPILSSDLKASTGIVEKMGNGVIVDACSLQKIADAAEQMLCDSNLLRELGENGKQAFMNTMNAEQAAQQVLALVDKIC